MRILVDTNLLLRIANGESDPQHDVAEESISRLRVQGHLPALVPQNLYEFWSVATRPSNVNGLGMSKAEAQFAMDEFSAFLLLQDERAILSEWRKLVARYDITGKTTHDARLVAAMVRHGISHLLTFNEGHFARFDEITALTPRAVVSGAGL